MLRKRINLQLFAKGEEELDEELELNKEEISEESEEEIDKEAEDEENENDEEHEDSDESDKESAKPKKDKVTAAIIREKQENKKLRDRLAALEKEKADREQSDRDAKTKQRLVDEGLTEQEAEDRIADRRERDELKRELKTIKYGQQADKLASRYPEIYEHLDSFIDIVESSKGALTLDNVCKAKLDEVSKHEIRTKAEQEILLYKQKAKEKQIKTGESKADNTVKLTSDDERILANMNRKRQLAGKQPLSKKQYSEYMNG